MEEKNNKELNLRISNKHFQKIVTVSLLIGIITIFGFIIYYVLTPEEGFISLGILDENKEAKNPEGNLTLGENVTFYISVVNNLKRNAEFKLYILKGDNNTNNILNHVEGSGASVNYTISNITIINGEEWLSEPQNISFYELGENHMVIVELWEILPDYSERYWNHDWFRLNITAT